VYGVSGPADIGAMEVAGQDDLTLMYVTLELEPRIDIFICFCAELQPTNYRES
jgi:hypothetical protein